MAEDSTCYLNRSDVRIVLIEQSDRDGLAKVDTLQIFTTADLAPVRCSGCGSSWTNEQLAAEKLRHPRIVSCCPEREPLTIDQWRERADKFEMIARNLVEWTYLHSTEGQVWPSTATRLRLTELAARPATQADADAMKAEAPPVRPRRRVEMVSRYKGPY